jgi:hypothetical protein
MLRVKKLIVIAIVVKLLLLPLLLMLSLPFVEEFFLWSMGSSCRASVDLVSYILKKCVGWDCLGPFFLSLTNCSGKENMLVKFFCGQLETHLGSPQSESGLGNLAQNGRNVELAN